MPLTLAQRTSVRRYLGWSARYADVDTALERAFTFVDGDTATSDLVVLLLGKLDTISANLEAAYGRLKALEVGSIKLSGGGELAALKTEGRRFAGQLAAAMGVEVRNDAFGYSYSGGYMRHS